MRKFVFALMLVLLFVPAALAGKADNSVSVRNVSDQKTFDPYRTTDLVDWQTHYQIFDSLFWETPDGKFVPALCTDYSISPDGLEMLFTIREGVKFHNGDVMTADDVVFSLNTAIASPFTSKFTSVMKEASKVDGKTVKLTLKHPYKPIIGCLVSSSTSIVPKKVYEADPDGFGQKPVGTGPYMLKDVRSGESITMEAFPDYFKGEAKVKTHIVRVIKDNMSALMAMQSGTLDRMVPNQDYSDRQAIIDDPNLVYYEAPQACSFLVAFNTARGPFADKRLREAVARAIDKEELILGAVNGMAEPTDEGIVPLCPQAPKGFKGLEYDIEKAKALVAEAGYPKGLTVTMRVIGATNYTKPAEILQAQLRNIGIDMKIEAMDRARWFDLVLNKAQFDVTFYAHAISVADADFCTYPFLHSSQLNGKGTNYMGVNIPELDECLDKARSSLDDAERNKEYLRVCEIIRDESLYIPCYTGKRTVAAVKDLKGVFADPMQRYYIYNYSW
ncbi:MAG: ABC transporter substrate-binding protein [Fretibacterium sp.]|nr:ABC transporter substrate-binding protein [Fretibacterium sp.]